LDAEVEPLDSAYGYPAYIAELEAAIEQLSPWWQQLVATHGRKRVKLRWPSGIASHPRVLAIYRHHHRRLLNLRPPPPPGPPPRFDDDAAWGSEVEAKPAMLIPPAPELLLVDRLHVEAPHLHARMVYLLMPPIGELPQPRPTMQSLQVVEPDTHAPRAFDFAHRHDVARGLERLLGAGADLRPRASATAREPSRSDADDTHRLAHAAWLRDLERALIEAERAWARELTHREARGSTREQALDDLYATHRAGPVGHPRVLGVIQAYWALCHEINHALVDAKRHVAPENLLLGWLRTSSSRPSGPDASSDRGRDSWLEILSALPYWPVGLDTDGRWF
jgi:hypothetical protein